MADTFNLTASFDKPSYSVGDTMILTVSGSVTSDAAPVSASIIVTAADGATTQLSAASQVGGASLTFAITAVTDTANRTWTIIDGLSASAIA